MVQILVVYVIVNVLHYVTLGQEEKELWKDNFLWG